MASMKTAISLSIGILATVFVATASAGGNNFCGGADDKVLCAQLIGGAKTWEAAMTNAINGVVAKVEGGKSTVDAVAAKLPRGLKPVTLESITSTCHEVYDNIIDNLKESSEFVKNDPTSALNTHLSAISYSDCTDGLDEFGLNVPEATQFADEVLKLAGVLLAVSETKN